MEVPLVSMEEKPGFFKRFGMIFSAPGELFAGLAKKPDLIWPVLFLLISLSFSFSISKVSTQVLVDTFPKYAEALQMQQNSVKLVSGLVGGLLGAGLFWLIRAGVFSLLAKILGGTVPKFGSVLSVVGYTYLPQTLRTIFQGSVAALTDTIPPLGLEMGMEIGERLFTPMGLFLGEINPFSIFYLILSIIALEKTFNLSRVKAISITILCWVASLGYSMLMVSLSYKFLN